MSAVGGQRQTDVRRLAVLRPTQPTTVDVAAATSHPSSNGQNLTLFVADRAAPTPTPPAPSPNLFRAIRQ